MNGFNVSNKVSIFDQTGEFERKGVYIRADFPLYGINSIEDLQQKKQINVVFSAFSNKQKYAEKRGFIPFLKDSRVAALPQGTITLTDEEAKNFSVELCEKKALEIVKKAFGAENVTMEE